MKLIWKLSFPQMCLVICIGLISFIVINSSFDTLREKYVRATAENHFQRITKDIDSRAKASAIQASLIVRMPVVIHAYEVALDGNIDDPQSPHTMAAREILRREFVPILESHEETTGQKPQIHFYLPNGLSLAAFVHFHEGATVLDPGSGGFAIRGIIPVKTPNGRQLGTAEVLQSFDALLEAAGDAGDVTASLYANKELTKYSVTLQNMASDLSRLKGDFVRVSKSHSFESLITAEILKQGKEGNSYKNLGTTTLAMHPLRDYSGNQVGIIVCALNTEDISSFVHSAGITLGLMLAAMAMASTASLMFGSRRMVIKPLDRMKAKIQDIVEDRADLNEHIPTFQRDEIGELAGWFNLLTAKVGVMLDDLHEAIRKKTEIEMSLEKEKDFFQTTIDSIGDAVITLSKYGFVITMNDAAETITALNRKLVIGKHISSAFTWSEGENFNFLQCLVEKSLGADAPPVTNETLLLRTDDDVEKHISFSCSPIRSISGNNLGAVLVFRDVSELKKQTEKMEFLIYHDKLTGLYNRAFFEQSCNTLQQDNVFPITIIMGDANGLKQANDVYGHAAGDILLQTIALAFKNSCRSDDIIARWGGDEFVAILPDLTRKRAKKIIQNIHEFCAAAKTDPIKVSVALGMATKESPNVSLDELLEIAEKRMYRSKHFMKQGLHATFFSDSRKTGKPNATLQDMTERAKTKDER